MNPNLVELFQKLPGIGPKQATRFVYYLMRSNDKYKDSLIKEINNIKLEARECPVCYRYHNYNNHDKARIGRVDRIPQRGQLATDADLAEAALQADPGRCLPERAAVARTVQATRFRAETVPKIENCGGATAEVFDATETKLTVTVTSVEAPILQARLPNQTHVDRAVQGDRRLRRGGACKSAQNCKSEQRFFHFNYLLG